MEKGKAAKPAIEQLTMWEVGSIPTFCKMPKITRASSSNKKSRLRS